MHKRNIKRNELYVKAPRELFEPLLKIPKRTLMGPGPSNCSPRVLRALGNQVLGHLHLETSQIMQEIKLGLKYAFQTENRLTLAISASGHAGMEACLGNLLEPEEKVLIVVGGIWGERAIDMAKRIGAKVVTLVTELGVAFTLEELESAMKKHRPDVVFVVHAESSTGLKQPLEGVGDIVHKYGALLIVDTVASLGGEIFFADAWGVDAVYTGSQKVLGAPAGITPVSFSPRAEYVSLRLGNIIPYVKRLNRKKIFSRKSKVPVFYWDMKLLGDFWKCFNDTTFYHHTISSTMIYGLREALAILAEEGLEACWARHAEVKNKLHRELEKRGLEFFVKNPEHRLTTVTAIKIPLGTNGTIISRRTMENCNVEISGGLGPTAGQILRIGLMGINANPDHVDLVLNALDEGIKFSRGHKL